MARRHMQFPSTQAQVCVSQKISHKLGKAGSPEGGLEKTCKTAGLFVPIIDRNRYECRPAVGGHVKVRTKLSRVAFVPSAMPSLAYISKCSLVGHAMATFISVPRVCACRCTRP